MAMERFCRTSTITAPFAKASDRSDVRGRRFACLVQFNGWSEATIGHRMSPVTNFLRAAQPMLEEFTSVFRAPLWLVAGRDCRYRRSSIMSGSRDRLRGLRPCLRSSLWLGPTGDAPGRRWGSSARSRDGRGPFETRLRPACLRPLADTAVPADKQGTGKLFLEEANPVRRVPPVARLQGQRRDFSHPGQSPLVWQAPSNR